MADNDTMSESQEIQGPADLETLLQENRKLLKENNQLRQKHKASEFLENFSQFIESQKKDGGDPGSGSADQSRSGEGAPNQGNTGNNKKLPAHLSNMKPAEKTDNYGPEIDQKICDVLAECWHGTYRKEEIIDALEAQVRPKNALALKPLEVNNINMTKTGRTNEKEFRYIGNAICGAGKSLAYLMDMLTSAEATCLQEAPDDGGKLELEELQFDFPRANMLLAQAMKILGMANIQTGQARRLILASKFKDEYKKLCDPDNPFVNGKFFGPDLDTATACLASQNKIQKTALEQPIKNKSKSSKKWNQRRNQGNTSALQAAVIQQALTAAQPQQYRAPAPATVPASAGVPFLGLPQQQWFPHQPQPLFPHFNQFLHNRGGGRNKGHGRGRTGRGRR